ncbi:MAG: DUF5916 domain-containing protein [Gammaproteobacteria bacterium]|nr:DUF5916 domain-containing protein [Gammaproteobacteria bacterium]MDP2141408.1 DUF5916 domain-containing protein [Gammaproteobacteria bacterium]MDP2346428.1 DUF5916 domain-containing protein [Gammaproteobacteria bacterium]
MTDKNRNSLLARASVVFCLALALIISSVAVQAQEVIPQLTQVDEATANITLDGRLDEGIWARIPAIDGMRVVIPDTLAEASLETHTKIFYTERGIYVGVMNFQDPATLVARMTSRDTRLERDGFVFNIDPSGEGLYGYMMRINLGGSMTDGTILPERQMNLQWDGSWDAETSVVENGWVAEIYVPWSMVALPQVAGETRRIGIYTERQLGALNEVWSFPALPDTVNEFLSAFHKFELQDIEPRTQITYYPYVSTTYDGIKEETELRAGAEVFWRPSSNTQVSASLNPDFGNVESDDVVVNLTAFETFFPEKRSFFLEGQDVFNTTPRSQGARGPGGPTSLLNTRRIGGQALYTVPTGVAVTATDLSQPTDLLGAVKLTGQSGSWRYGTLLASEDDSEIRGRLANGTRVKLEAEGRDFAVGRLLYENTTGGGRRAIGWMGTTINHPDVDAVVNGIDLHYFSTDTRWVADAQLMHSDADGVKGAGGFADIIFQPQRGRQHRIALAYLDDKLDINDLGFISRNDQIQAEYNFSLNESNIPGLRSRNSSFQVINQWNTSGQPTRLGLFFNRNYTLLNNQSIRTGLRYFNPRIDDRLGRGSGEFRIPERWSVNVGWGSDPGRPIVFNVNMDASQEDIGPKSLGASAGVSYRPVDTFSLGVDLDYTDREALLVYKGAGRYTSFEATQWSPKVTMDYFISAKQQLRFSMQWTGLKAYEDRFWQVNANKLAHLIPVAKPNATPDDFIISRMTFQARYRWEIAPLSDLFVVYTRGSNLPGTMFDDYGGMLVEAWNEPIVDTLVVKLRYRLGS